MFNLQEDLQKHERIRPHSLIDILRFSPKTIRFFSMFSVSLWLFFRFASKRSTLLIKVDVSAFKQRIDLMVGY